MDSIAALTITPFQDIVNQGNAAINNAGDSQPMLKAARSLVKEGERALERIEPLCKKHFDKFGSNFLAALQENNELTGYRTQLDDLLWAFDEYVKVEDFDADKFAELQALSRAAAPKIRNILLTMKLEAPSRFNTRGFMSQPSPPSSPDPPPPAPSPAVSNAGERDRGSISSNVTDPSLYDIRITDEELGIIVDGTESYGTASGSSSSGVPLTIPHQPEPEEELPRPPLDNPWDVNRDVAADEYYPRGKRYRPRSHSGGGFSVPRPPVNDDDDRRSGLVIYHDADGGGRRRSFITHLSEYSFSRDGASRPRGISTGGNAPHSIPEEGLVNGAENGRPYPYNGAYPLISYPSHPNLVSPYQTSPTDGRDSTKIPYRTNSASDQEPQVVRDRAPSIAESLVDPYQPPVQSNPIERRPVAATTDRQPGLELALDRPLPPIPPIPPTIFIDSDLIPLDPVLPSTYAPMSPGNCIINEHSSFNLHKGFCAGALEVLEGGIGIKKTKKPVGLSATATVARCGSCSYELDFRQLELDINEGNFVNNGVGHRLRFLQKSHLHTKRVDDVLYGCIFCVRMGRTLDESDATVFTNTAALFSHLARHPRPLPEVPGISVVDQVKIPAHLRNDYDLYFKNPPESHPVREKTVRPEASPDRAQALELLQGAKIVGLTWPAKYNGEWCKGWHDGVHAALPTEIIKLDRPDWSQIQRSGSTSRIRARARWRFAPKDKEDWLRFDKDEIITNISWSYAEHWCWSGTNAKGKWGIFPQAFVDTNTVQELTPAGSDRASVLSIEKNKSSSILPRFSLRSKSGRPPSIAESVSSGETNFRPGPTMNGFLFHGGSWARDMDRHGIT
ncbi:hypothetical protein PT974_01013 [Cladobotryum mycophilum]|uniref:SH3 domain-containing protein n=1 Tax=Cladobotryum mycophilum TaxID=491253 RepID=A0ABR0T2Q0_9HYPO